MKRWLIGVLTAGCFMFSGQVSNASELELPKDTYMWVQSTARVNYYFNTKEMHYGMDQQGYIDLKMLHVTTVLTYDELQVEDVVTKRRWKDLSLDGYEDLVGEVNDLTFNLYDGTVKVTKHLDVDSNMGTIGEDDSREPIKLESLTEKNVEGKFYRAILEYADKHKEDIIKNSEGELSKEDRKQLEKEKKDAEKAALKVEKEKKKDKKDKTDKKEKKDKQTDKDKDSKDK